MGSDGIATSPTVRDQLLVAEQSLMAHHHHGGDLLVAGQAAIEEIEAAQDQGARHRLLAVDGLGVQLVEALGRVGQAEVVLRR